MSSNENPRHLSIAELQKRCAQETNRFMQGLGGEAWHCFEIFRRALVEKNDGSWEALDNQYRNQVRRWVLQHPRFPAFDEGPDLFVNMAFEKFWKRNFSAIDFARFPNIRSILAYLKTCVASVITDYGRNQSRIAKVVYLDDVLLETYPKEFIHHDLGDMKLEQDEFWQTVRVSLGDEGMYQAVYGSFVLGLRPSEIYELHPLLFKDVRDVYRLKAKALGLLEDQVHQLSLLSQFPRREE